MHAHAATSDRVFHALGDATRRAIVAQLGEGPASVSELARPLPVSLAAVVQHVQVLEASGLVATRKQGRVRTCHLNPTALLEAEHWLAQRRALWEGRLDRLGALVQERSTRDARPTDDPATTRTDATTTAPSEEE
jgi:DNA-binding transcriptional ArsR family regulator